LVCDSRVLVTIGTNDSDVAGSVQTTSASARLPEITSNNPHSACGASERVSDGLRRSQSSRIALPPAWAIRRARLAATVDLPSPGLVDVIPMTFDGFARATRSMLT